MRLTFQCLAGGALNLAVEPERSNDDLLAGA